MSTPCAVEHLIRPYSRTLQQTTPGCGDRRQPLKASTYQPTEVTAAVRCPHTNFSEELLSMHKQASPWSAALRLNKRNVAGYILV